MIAPFLDVSSLFCRLFIYSTKVVLSLWFLLTKLIILLSFSLFSLFFFFFICLVHVVLLEWIWTIFPSNRERESESNFFVVLSFFFVCVGRRSDPFIEAVTSCNFWVCLKNGCVDTVTSVIRDSAQYVLIWNAVNLSHSEWVMSFGHCKHLNLKWRASLVPAAAVIPAPLAYTIIVAVKRLVVGLNTLNFFHFNTCTSSSLLLCMKEWNMYCLEELTRNFALVSCVSIYFYDVLFSFFLSLFVSFELQVATVWFSLIFWFHISIILSQHCEQIRVYQTCIGNECFIMECCLSFKVKLVRSCWLQILRLLFFFFFHSLYLFLYCWTLSQFFDINKWS